jgi:uncharacterized membrane-anchored protein
LAFTTERVFKQAVSRCTYGVTILFACLAASVCHATNHRLVPLCASAHYQACGLVDRSGNWVVEPKYSAIYENEKYWSVERASGLSGLLDAEGRELILPRFHYIGRFVNGIAPATLPGPRDTPGGYIDNKGAWVIEPKFWSAPPFNGATSLAWLGPSYEQRQLVLVRRDGSLKPIPYEDNVDSKDGRYVVRNGATLDSAEGSTSYGLDHNGNVLVAGRRNESLTIVPGGGWIVTPILESDGKAQVARILDRNGKELFRVTGPEAWIRSPYEVEHEVPKYAQFSSDGEREGIVDIVTGEVVLPAGNTDVGLIVGDRMSLGVYNNEQWRYGLRDVRGKIIVPPRYESLDFFAYGYAAAIIPEQLQVERERDQPVERDLSGYKRAAVIDRDGNEVRGFAKFKPDLIDLSPWNDGPQSQVRRDVAEVYSGQTRYYTTLEGQVIASIETKTIDYCDTQVVRNARGEVIWPRHAKLNPREATRVSCAARSFMGSRLETPPELVEPLAEITAFEAGVQQERARIDAQGGGIMNLLDPERAARQSKFNAAPWVAAPTEIQLGAVATLKLAEGFRYLSPADTAALHAEIEPDSPLLRDIALLSAPDHRWTLYVRIIESGLVSLTDPLSDPESLLQEFRRRHMGLLVGRPPYNNSWHIYQWDSEPRIDHARHRLDFTVGFRDLEADSQADLISVTRFGRSHAIAGVAYFGGLMKMHDAKLYREEILAAMDAIEFAAGERYTDVDNETRPARSLASFITGLPTGHEAPLPAVAAYHETAYPEKSNWPLVVLGIMVILAVVAFIPRHRNQ